MAKSDERLQYENSRALRPLLDFVTLYERKPLDPDARKIGRWWTKVRKTNASAFSRAAFAIYRLIFFQYRNQPSPPPQPVKIALCSGSTCWRKQVRSREDADCPFYAFGVCSIGTSRANDGEPLTLESIGYLAGMGKEGVRKYVEAAQDAMIEAIMNDPELRDLCMDYGIKGAG